MKAKVYGIQRDVRWNYNGQSGSNQRLHLCYPDKLPAPDEGYRVETMKVSKKVDLSGITAGDTVEIYFNRFGAVETVVKV